MYLSRVGNLLISNAINRKIKEHLGEGVQSSITLGALRSISIFVLGQVDRPCHLYLRMLIIAAPRGKEEVSMKGSMRKIVLKRDGEVKSTLDLYDLLEGNSEDDLHLEAGDVVLYQLLAPRSPFRVRSKWKDI